MDEIVIVLPNLIYTKFEIENWGQALPEIKVGGPRPMRPPRFRHLLLEYPVYQVSNLTSSSQTFFVPKCGYIIVHDSFVLL